MNRIVALFCAVTVAAALAADPVQPFNGKDLTGWKVKGDAAKSKWKVGKAELDKADNKKFTVTDGGNEMINAEAHSLDFYSEATFGSGIYEVELMVPKDSNSGVYIQGEYEIQILDSWGKDKVGTGDIGALYGAAPPKENASKAPGEWQKFVIDFDAAKFDAEGKKIANAKFNKVELNGKVIQENVEMKGPTPGGISGKEAAKGPLMFQGNHGVVAFRNIKITPK